MRLKESQTEENLFCEAEIKKETEVSFMFIHQ